MGMGLYWSALVKAIGMLGDSSEQGRLFGFLEGVRGVTSTIIGFVGTAVVAASVAEAAGVLWLIRIYGVLCFVFAALVWLFVKGDEERLAALGSSTVTLRQLWLAAKNKYTWLIGFTVMLMYCFYTTLGYFSPLLEYRYGMAAALIGVIGVIRTYVFQFVAGPAGGMVVDKVTKSSPRFLRWMFAAARSWPWSSSCCRAAPPSCGWRWADVRAVPLVFASRGVYWAQVGEVEVPENERGGVIGPCLRARVPARCLPARPVRLVDRRPVGHTRGARARRRLHHPASSSSSPWRCSACCSPPSRTAHGGASLTHAPTRHPVARAGAVGLLTHRSARPPRNAPPGSPRSASRKSELRMDITEFNLDFFSLGGKNAIVTGGNTGLGQAFSLALAKAGANVFVPCSPTTTAPPASWSRPRGARCSSMLADITAAGRAASRSSTCASTPSARSTSW